MSISRGIRNCNPGNIRKSSSPFRGEVTPSQDPQFKQFIAPEWGYRAMFLIIHNYNELYGINTLQRVIKRWAPPVENDTQLYVNAIAKRLNILPTDYINSKNRDTMIPLVCSMSKIENGVEPPIEQVERGWSLFLDPLSCAEE